MVSSFMTTNKVDVTSAPSSPPPAPPPPQASNARLVLLLGLLAIVIGAYAYDFFVAKPKCEAADKKIQEFVDARNKMGVKEGALVTPDELHKELGMQPTWVDKHADKHYEVEYYCWWGHIPLLNMRRHFISVVYIGDEPRRFSSHHRELPPDEALPISNEPLTDDAQPLPMPQSASAGSSGDKGDKKATEKTEEAASAETKNPPAKD